jgi:hypothetical protein
LSRKKIGIKRAGSLLALSAILVAAILVTIALSKESGQDECVDAGAAVPITSQRTRGLPRSEGMITGKPAKRVSIRPAAGIGVELKSASLQSFPWFIDSNSPAFWVDGVLYLFNSMDGFQTFRSSGPSVSQLSGLAQIQLPIPERPGKVWLEAVWYDAEAKVLYGWYHFEPTTLLCLTAPAIGAAASYDLGLTWENRGFIVENAYDIDCDYDNGYFSGGSGDLSVVLAPDRSYFYFFFSTYSGPLEEQGVAMARSRFSERGQPGTLLNYYQGEWTEPSLGGKATSLFPSSTGWMGPEVEAFWGPSVHWNTYLQRYVMLVNHAGGIGFEQEGIYISFSRDLGQWSLPQKLIDGGGWYPQVLGLASGETDSFAGQTSRFYQARLSCYSLEFSIPARR